MDTETAVVDFFDPTASDAILLFNAPTDALGGGITILSATFVNHAATDTTNSFSIGLHKYSNAGTPAVNGTIAAAIGGTATGTTAPWADSVPRDFTIDSSYAFLDAGEWLVANYTKIGTGAPTRARLVIKYALGR